jgi:hypothetical protein
MNKVTQSDTKKFDIFIGRINHWFTYRAASMATNETLEHWLAKGYRIETEFRIGRILPWYEVYLVKH